MSSVFIMWRILYFLFFAVIIQNIFANDEQPTVEISSGKLRGKLLEARNGRNYNAFLGIPYGKAERFKVATNPEPWNETRDASDFGEECAQFDIIRRKVVGTDDCLFLNVYTPKLSPEEKLPVMVWLHTGGFSFGSGNFYGAKYFMSEDVVLVTLNYRLAVFGFLDTQDEHVPGNLGLRDQKHALQWVQDNIEGFGGDRGKVTLFGSSAGAASVALHMLTDTDLFHRAISQSSSALSPWLIQRSPRRNVEKLASFLRCPSKEMAEIIKCLESKGVAEIISAVDKFKLGTSISKVNFLFTPSVESSQNSGAYLSDCPLNLMDKKSNKRKIPWMVGFTKNDGLLNLGPFLKNPEMISELLENWDEHAPWLFVYHFDAEGTLRDDISEKIKLKFLRNVDKGNNEDLLQSLATLVGDRWEVSGTIESVKRMIADNVPVYPFIFSYFGNFSYVNEFNGLKSRYGVGHLDELQYLFDGVYGAPEYGEESEIRKFSEKLVKLWVYFARTGNPETEEFKSWSPAILKEPLQFYNINDPEGENILFDSQFKERMEFWKQIMPSSCKSPHYQKNAHSEL